MFLLYSSTSSLVCTEVSVGACLTWGSAADNYLLKNGIMLSSTVATQTYQSVSHLYKDIFSLGCRTGRCFNSCSLLLILTGGISLVSHLRGGFSARVAKFPPGRCGVQAPKAFYFLRLFSTAWEQREERVEEGREKAKKKRAAPCL